MNTCPSCANSLPEGDMLCTLCGHVATPSIDALPAATAEPLPARGPLQRTVVAAVVTTLLAAGMVYGALGIRARREATPQPAPVVSGDKAPAAPAVHVAGGPPTVSGPKWTRSRQSGWATDGSRTVTFELKAEREVPVWMRRVVPTLALRCLGRQVEVFVVTDWPARLEERPDKHTVTIGFDGATAIAEEWEASEDQQTLFAPDGAAFTRRLLGAKTLQFGFNPYNASPVSTEFDLSGVDKLAPQVAKTCRRTL
jgi:hypothetical protein